MELYSERQLVLAGTGSRNNGGAERTVGAGVGAGQYTSDSYHYMMDREAENDKQDKR